MLYPTAWTGWAWADRRSSVVQIRRYTGYYESYAQGHDVLDRGLSIQKQVKNVAKTVANAIAHLRQALYMPAIQLRDPRQK